MINNTIISSFFWHCFHKSSAHVCLISINISSFCLLRSRFFGITLKVSTVIDPYKLQTFINVIQLSNIELRYLVCIFIKSLDMVITYVYEDNINYACQSLRSRKKAIIKLVIIFNLIFTSEVNKMFFAWYQLQSIMICQHYNSALKNLTYIFKPRTQIIFEK